jgi:ABC-type glutathione transport system ATPase component
VTETNAKEPLLEVRNLKTYYYTEDGIVKAVDGVDFYVNSGEVLGLVGESGCGKSVTSLSIMRLISQPGKIVSGEILLEGKDLVKATEEEMTKVRGNRVSMIFQQPQTALCLQSRRPDLRGTWHPPEHGQGKGTRSRGGTAQDGGYPRA